MTDPQQKPLTVDDIETLIASGKSEEEILASLGVAGTPKEPSIASKWMNPSDPRIRGMQDEVASIVSGLFKGKPQPTSGLGFAVDALRNPLGLPISNTIEGLIGQVKHVGGLGLEAIQGNKEAQGKLIPHAAMALIPAARAGLRATPAAASRTMGAVNSGLNRVTQGLSRRLAGPEPPSFADLGAPSAEASNPYVWASTQGRAGMPPPAPSALEVLQEAAGAKAAPPRLPAHAPALDQIPQQLPPALRAWLEESMAGTPSPASRPFMQNFNPEMPFAAGELSGGPTIQNALRLALSKKK